MECAATLEELVSTSAVRVNPMIALTTADLDGTWMVPIRPVIVSSGRMSYHTV
jgi:hypothetical protein